MCRTLFVGIWHKFICITLLIRLVVDFVGALSFGSVLLEIIFSWLPFILLSCTIFLYICWVIYTHSLSSLTSRLANREHIVSTIFASLGHHGLLVPLWHWDVLFYLLYCLCTLLWILTFIIICFILLTYFTLAYIHFSRICMQIIKLYILFSLYIFLLL